MSTLYPIDFNGWKVLNAGTHAGTRGRVAEGLRSSSLNTSKGVTEYKPETQNPQTIYTGPAIENTPILAFDNLDAAVAWVRQNRAERPDYQGKVFAIHGLARLVIPVTKVLHLSVGWADKAQAFWNAYVMGGNLSRFELDDAPAHTVAVFGIVSLGQEVAVPTLSRR